MRRRLAFIRDTRGAAAVEMALILPLLVIMMFVGFEAGYYFYTEHQIIKAVREGARYGGRQPFADFNCGAGSIDAGAVARIRQVTRTGTVTGTTARVRDLALTDIAVTLRCDSSYASQGIFKGTSGGAPIVLVHAEAPYNSLFGQLGAITSGVVVQARAEAVVSGI